MTNYQLSNYYNSIVWTISNSFISRMFGLFGGLGREIGGGQAFLGYPAFGGTTKRLYLCFPIASRLYLRQESTSPAARRGCTDEYNAMTSASGQQAA